MTADAPADVDALADAVAQRIAPLMQPSARRLALSVDEAARAIGVSRDHFDRHVLPRIRVAHVGRRKLVPVVELERFLERQSV